MKTIKKIITGFGMVAALGICVYSINLNKTSVEANVKNNLTNIFKEDNNTITSSNPYVYTNSKYYKNIVNMGMDAVNVLSNGLIDKEQASLDGYVAALAVTEITGIDMNKISGKDWETADEFWQLWDQMIEKMPSEFNKILEKEDDAKEKLQDYGIFGEALIYNMIETEDKKIQFADKSIEINENIELGKLENLVDKKTSELEKAENYVEQYCK